MKCRFLVRLAGSEPGDGGIIGYYCVGFVVEKDVLRRWLAMARSVDLKWRWLPWCISGGNGNGIGQPVRRL